MVGTGRVYRGGGHASQVPSSALAGKGVWVLKEVGSNLAAAQRGHEEDPRGKEVIVEREFGALNSWFRNLGFLLSNVSYSRFLEIILHYMQADSLSEMMSLF